MKDPFGLIYFQRHNPFFIHFIYLYKSTLRNDHFEQLRHKHNDNKQQDESNKKCGVVLLLAFTDNRQLCCEQLIKPHCDSSATSEKENTFFILQFFNSLLYIFQVRYTYKQSNIASMRYKVISEKAHVVEHCIQKNYLK